MTEATGSVQVIVPIFNERGVLDELHQRLTAALERTARPWSIVYVDDGSRDGSTDRILALCSQDARVGAVVLARNFGLQSAINAGLSVATGDAVVLIDGDLQDPPELIPDLIAKWAEGHDVVYAVKSARKEWLVKRWCFAVFHRLMARLSAIEIPPQAGNFSVMDRRVVATINEMPERHRYISGLRAFVGGRQVGVPFQRDARFSGRPRQTVRRLFRLAGDAIFGFSHLPLRLTTILGFVVSFAAFVVMLNVLYKKWVSDEAIIGWASTMTSILFIGGIQLICLGIIGEYIARIFDEIKGRPDFIIARTENLTPPPQRRVIDAGFGGLTARKRPSAHESST